MNTKWKSRALYQHPVKHQAETHGNVVLSTAGVYCLQVGGSTMSCPQDWATKIHAYEEGEITIDVLTRKVDRQTWSQFQGYCRFEGTTATQKLKDLIKQYVDGQRSE